MRRIAAWAFSGPALLHESLHYLAARILGVEAELVVRPEERQAYIRVTAAKPWQDLFITLAPAAFGLLASPLVLTQAAAENTSAKVLLLSAWILWMAACWQDYVDAWSVLRQKP
ncbi:MAG: hypothetical protein KF698_08390 [Anaerolineales bacterium]|nr:hypothetical protein [Anaerolineales bacterium]